MTLQEIETQWQNLQSMIRLHENEFLHVSSEDNSLGICVTGSTSVISLQYDSGYETWIPSNNPDYMICMTKIYKNKLGEQGLRSGTPLSLDSSSGPEILTTIEGAQESLSLIQIIIGITTTIDPMTFLPDLPILKLNILWIPTQSAEIYIFNLYPTTLIRYEYMNQQSILSFHMNQDYTVHIDSALLVHEDILLNLPAFELNTIHFRPLYCSIKPSTIETHSDNPLRKEVRYLPNELDNNKIVNLEGDIVFAPCMFQERYLTGVLFQANVTIENFVFPIFFHRIFPFSQLQIWCFLETAFSRSLRFKSGILSGRQTVSGYMRNIRLPELELNAPLYVPTSTLRCRLIFKKRNGESFSRPVDVFEKISLNTTNFEWYTATNGVYQIRNVPVSKYITYPTIDPIDYTPYTLNVKNSVATGYYSQNFEVIQVSSEQPIYNIKDLYSDRYLHISNNQLSLGGITDKMEWRFRKLSESQIALMTWNKKGLVCLVLDQTNLVIKPIGIENLNSFYTLDISTEFANIKFTNRTCMLRRWGDWFRMYVPINAVDDTPVQMIYDSRDRFALRNLGNDIITICSTKTGKFLNIRPESTASLTAAGFFPNDTERCYWFRWSTGKEDGESLINIRNNLYLFNDSYIRVGQRQMQWRYDESWLPEY